MYEITEKYRELSEILASSDDDAEGLEEALQEAFSELMQEQAQGAEVAAKIIRLAESLNTAAKLEADRIKLIIDRRKSRIDRAKKTVLESMIATNINSIETSIATFSIMKGRESTKVHDIEALEKIVLNAEFGDELENAINVEVIKKPVLKVIKALIADGKIPEEIASQVRSEKTLKIK